MIDVYKKPIYEFAEKYQIPYFKDTTPDWSVRENIVDNYPLIEDAFTKNVKDNLLGLSKQSYEWNGLVNKQIIAPFMETIIWNNDSNNQGVSFDIANYRDYPLCFWNIIFANIFYHLIKIVHHVKAFKIL